MEQASMPDRLAPMGAGPVVAIIDDDPDLRRTVADLLGENGFTPLPWPMGPPSWRWGRVPRWTLH